MLWRPFLGVVRTPSFGVPVRHACATAESIDQSIDHVLTSRPLSAGTRRQVHEDSSRAGDEARLAWPRHGLVEDFASLVGAVDVPVLVLSGDDQVDPPQVLREHLLPAIPTATLTEIDGTGHLAPLEAPDRVAEHINAFVAGR